MFRFLNSSLQLHTAENTRPLQQSAYAWALSLHSSRAFCLRRKSRAASALYLAYRRFNGSNLQYSHPKNSCTNECQSFIDCLSEDQTMLLSPSSTLRDTCCSGSFIVMRKDEASHDRAPSHLSVQHDLCRQFGPEQSDVAD